MQAQAILDSTLDMKRAGMTQAQAEAIARTIIMAVEPLARREEVATKADLSALRAEMASLKKEIRTDSTALRAEMASLKKETRADSNTLRAEMASLKKETRADSNTLRAEIVSHKAETKADLASLEKNLEIKIATLHTRIESMKVWLLTGLLGMSSGLIALAASIAWYAYRIAV